MTLAEKYIRQYNQFNGKKISKKQLTDYHSELKKAIDNRRIDSHVTYGVELLAIEKRIAKVLPKVDKRVKVICDNPVKIKLKKPRNIIITQTAQGPEVVKAKNKAVHYHHEDLTFFYGLPCEDSEADEPGLGYSKDGQQAIYDMVTNMMLDAMKKDGLFWRKPWSLSRVKGSATLAQNFFSKTVYRGVNYWITNFVVPSYGYKSLYYLTFKQVNDLKGKVKKGAKSWPIVYYTWYFIQTKPTKKSITSEQYYAMSAEKRNELGAMKLPVLQYYRVFNADDIEGIDFPTKLIAPPEESKIESAERIVNEMPKAPPIRTGVDDRAFYSPGSDYISMPPMTAFSKEQEYYSTLFHEMVHSTGHPSRVGRTFGGKGTKEYAFEELIAELGASYLCAEAGILYFTLNNSAVYLKNWLSRLQDIMASDNKFFLMAAGKAQHAADFILDVHPEEKPTPENPPAEKSRPAVKREAPVKEKHPNLSGVVDASQIGSLKFSKIDLDGDYKTDFLKIYSDTQMMIWGSPGSGKTVYTLKFAQYLAEKKNLKVLYVAHEELGRSTFTEKIIEFNIGHANLKFVKSLEALSAANLSLDDFDAIFFDSINSIGWTLEDYRKFSEANPGIVKVLVVQSTKDGDFRGGKDWEHEVDIAGEVKNRNMILRKNRLDQEFAKKSDDQLIEEAVKDQKRKNLIREKVKVKENKSTAE
jgi:antirestriction protein ArdC